MYFWWQCKNRYYISLHCNNLQVHKFTCILYCIIQCKRQSMKWHIFLNLFILELSNKLTHRLIENVLPLYILIFVMNHFWENGIVFLVNLGLFPLKTFCFYLYRVCYGFEKQNLIFRVFLLLVMSPDLILLDSKIFRNFSFFFS